MKWQSGCEIICADSEKLDSYIVSLTCISKAIMSVPLILGHEDFILSLFRGIQGILTQTECGMLGQSSQYPLLLQQKEKLGLDEFEPSSNSKITLLFIFYLLVNFILLSLQQELGLGKEAYIY